MSKRKIAECLNVRINVGNYQHIEITKYAEEEIEYSSDSERIQKEQSLRDDLLTNLITSMKAIPERLNKGVAQAQEVEESIKKTIPEWLASGPVHNIANMAKAKVIQVAAEQKDNKDEHSKEVDVFAEQDTKKLIEQMSTEEVKKVIEKIEQMEKANVLPEVPDVDKVSAQDLFEDDVIVAPVKGKKEEKSSKPIKVEDKFEGFDDIFDDV